MFDSIFKKSGKVESTTPINVPTDDRKELTSAVKTYSVRWRQITGKYYDDHKEVAQFFTDKDEALEFAKALKNANKLIGHRNDTLTKVTVNEEVVNS